MYKVDIDTLKKIKIKLQVASYFLEQDDSAEEVKETEELIKILEDEYNI